MKLLILGAAILAAGDITETATEIHTLDAIYPKHVIEGYRIIELETPDGFVPLAYDYLDGALVKKPVVVPKPEVPQSISMRQARLALLAADLLDDVEAVVASAGRSAQIEWEFAQTVQRAHPLIATVKELKQLTDEQVDELFIQAATL